MKDKLLVVLAILMVIWCSVVVYGQVRARQECDAVGGVALRKQMGGTYCLRQSLSQNAPP